MTKTAVSRFYLLAVSSFLALLAQPGHVLADGAGPTAIDMGSTDLAGVVRGDNGPEAGVWVIAETTDLPTKYAKIVVTDDQGRYLIPELPKANYQVWVRGYGLVDSPKVKSEPGKLLDLKAVPAPTAAAAAEYYPAMYWYAMLNIPDKSEFLPGTPLRKGGPPTLNTQERWVELVKINGCIACHQLGNKATRTFQPALDGFKTSADKWERRIQSGQGGQWMISAISKLNPHRAFEQWGDWTDRIAAGELPFAKPPRPQGLERNIVVTLWDWADAKSYQHDEIATDKRNPTVNGYGLIYGSAEESSDNMPVLDPVRNIATTIKVPWRDADTPTTKDNPIFAASPYWGEEPIWDSHTNIHNPMFDELGRVWLTSRIRGPENPAYCKKGATNASAKLYPLDSSDRQLEIYDPKTGKFTFVDTCFMTHHLQFGFDANQTLWTSGDGGEVVGWLDRKKFEETHDAEKSQGWTAVILDTNGNGKRDNDYVEPDQPVDPTKDKRISAGFYAVAPSPVDGSIWGTVVYQGFPGGVVRLNLGSNPPETTLAEYYQPPWNNDSVPIKGYAPRGMDIDSKGVVWMGLASGQFASFDRAKCKGPLNGPTATGQQCPEGWTLYRFPGPQFKGLPDNGSVESSYYSWVDQHDTFGLGADTPIATGNLSDSLLALVDGKFVTLRVPYPLGFYAKGLDGRIDDPKGGWKARGLWSTFATRAPFHIEGGKGTTSKVVHFQLRPNPLAR